MIDNKTNRYSAMLLSIGNGMLAYTMLIDVGELKIILMNISYLTIAIGYFLQTIGY